jgi:hypothetical protein
MNIFQKTFDNIINRISNSVVDNINKKITSEVTPVEVVKSSEKQGLVLDTSKVFYRSTEKGIRKPTRITFQTLRRMSKAVHIARLCINTLKHKITQTEWTIKSKEENQADDKHIEILTEFFDKPNRYDSFRTFLDKLLEDILVLDAGCFEKVNDKSGLPAEIYFVDGATIKPMFDIHGEMAEPAYGQWMPMNQGIEPDAVWNRDEFVYIMQNPQGDIQNYGYGFSSLEGAIMAATNILNADNYMGQYFDVGTLPPKLINLGKDVPPAEVEAMRAYWKSEIEGKPWKTAFIAGSEGFDVVDMDTGKPIDMQFKNYQTWLMKILCGAFEISPQDIGMTAEMGLNRAISEVQQDISESKGYSSILQLLKASFNREIIKNWFGFDDVEFDWTGLDTFDPMEAANIFAIESKAGAVSINEYRLLKGLKPIKGGVKPFILLPGGTIKEIDATPIDDVAPEDLANEETMTENESGGKTQSETQSDSDISSINTISDESSVNKEGDYGHENVAGIRDEIGYTSESESSTEKQIEKKVHLDDYICWMDDRGFGQPFIWTDKFGKNGFVIKPPVAVNINGIDVEVKTTKEMADAGLNVKPVSLVAAVDINSYLPTTGLRNEFKRYQNMASEYYSKKWETKFGNSRKYDKYTVMPYIEGKGLTETLLLDDMKRVPGEYEKAITDLANLWKYEKEKGMGDRRANQYIITPDKRAYGFDYQFIGNSKAWEKYKFSIPHILDSIPRLRDLFLHLTGLDAEQLKVQKSAEDGVEKGIFTTDDTKQVWKELGIDDGDYSIDEFTIGMNEELEHKNITMGDPVMTAKIVMAHLDEKADYYTRLNEAMKKSFEKGYYKQRQIDEHDNFWKGVMDKPAEELASHLTEQSKKLKPNIARLIRDTAKTKKMIASDAVLSEAADKAPRNNLGLRYTKSVEDFYKQSFELGVKNFSKKIAKKLKGKGVSEAMIETVLGKKVEKSIERNKIYTKLKERGTNMIKIVAANKQERLLNYIENEADQGKPMSEISDNAMEKFSLPLEEFEVKRIAKTETAWAANQGSIEAGQELGVEKFEVLLDADACDDCQNAYADQLLSRDDLEDAGDPPLHPNCECSVEPFIDENNLDDLADNIIAQYKSE